MIRARKQAIGAQRRAGIVGVVASIVAISAGGLLLAGVGHAQNAVEIGGKTSVTGLFSVTTVNPDDFDDQSTILFGALAAYTTESARYEVGGGLTIAGLIAEDDFTLYSLTLEGRVNSNALGPEENVLLYLGAIAGLGIVRGDGALDIDDEIGLFGPKGGLEFYVSPNSAIQIQDAVLIDTEKGVTNQFTIGFKVLFNGVI